jgi:hypothetical protein
MEKIEVSRRLAPEAASTDTAAEPGERGRPGGRRHSTPLETCAECWWAAYAGATSSNR